MALYGVLTALTDSAHLGKAWGPVGRAFGRRSKQGGGGRSAPCRRSSKDAQDPPHTGLGPLRGLHFPEGAAQAASRGGLAASLAAEPGAAAAGFSPPSLGGQPSRDWAPATPRMAFPELGSGPLWRVGATGPVSAALRVCHAGDTQVRGLSG